MLSNLIGLAVVVVLGCWIGFIFWRYPDFRRAFIAHWRPAAIAQRLDAFAARLRRLEKPRTEEDALAHIREHLAALGTPVDHLTDGELRELLLVMVHEQMRLIAVSGVSAREAMRRMQEATDALAKSGVSIEEMQRRMDV